MFVLRSIVFFVAVLLIVLFALSNAHHVPLHFITGEPFNVRLIYLMLFSFIAGVACTTYLALALMFHLKKKRARRQQPEPEEDLGEAA